MKYNKEKKCKICKGRFTTHLSTRQVCGVDCSLVHARQKQTKKMQRQHQTEKKIFKTNDLPYQLKLTQPIFNKLRRLQEIKWFTDRGMEPECISCGKQNMDWCCGHFKTVGAQSILRFDPMNTYLQCNRYCNMALSGNIEGNKTTRGLKVGLKERFGTKRAREIINYCESKSEPYKWNCDDLIEMRKTMSQEVKKLLQP